jgi:solute carrier family 45 protein 1/2/4
MMSYGTPYLKSLGLSESLTALVWLAGPLSGSIAQPIFGALSDRCTNRFGRRRPFVLFGTTCVVLFLLLLACAPDLVHFVATPDGGKVHDCWVSTMVQTFAILSVYGLNISMQPLQSGTRALIIDTCPASQQAQASAWCSRFSGVGSVLIYLIGFTAVLTWAPLLAGTEFRALSIIGIIALLVTVATCLGISETPFSPKDYQDDKITAISIMRGLLQSFKTLPPTTWTVCKIQFFAWLAWFPVLYYSSTYIYEICKSPMPD